VKAWSPKVRGQTRLTREWSAFCSHRQWSGTGSAPISVYGTIPTPTNTSQVNRRQMAEAKALPPAPLSTHHLPPATRWILGVSASQALN
jgi:hypothetical protein